MTETYSVEVGLAAIAAFGIILLVNERLCSSVSDTAFDTIREAVAFRPSEKNIAKVAYWIQLQWVCLAFWLPLWGIAFLASSCIYALTHSELLANYNRLNVLMFGLYLALVSVIYLEHSKRISRLEAFMRSRTSRFLKVVYFVSLSSFMINEPNPILMLFYIAASLLFTLGAIITDSDSSLVDYVAVWVFVMAILMFGLWKLLD